MLAFSNKAPAIFTRAGLFLFCAELWLWVGKIPPLRYGTWHQIEPITFAVFVVAAISAAWLAFGFTRGCFSVSFRNPLLIAILTFMGWQWLAAGLADVPWRAWFGHPAIGIGAGYYTAFVLMLLQACALWNEPGAKRVLLGGMLASFVVLSATYIDIDGSFNAAEKADWPDYLPFAGAYLLAACAAGGVLRRWQLALALYALLAVAVCYISNNQSALVLFIAFSAGTATWWLVRRVRPSLLAVGRFWRVAFCLASLAPLLWWGISLCVNWSGNWQNNLATRAAYNIIVRDAVVSEPGILLHGNGAGAFTDAAVKYAMIDGVYAFTDGQMQPNWIGLFNTAYHSHNKASDGLLALGLPGMVLGLLLPVLAIVVLRKEAFWILAPPLAFVCILQSVWFELPQLIGFQALFWAVLLSSGKPVLQAEGKRWYAVIAAGLCIVMIASSYGHYGAMRYGHTLSQAVKTEPAEGYITGWMLEDVAHGGDRLRENVWFFGKWISGRVADGVVSERDLDWYRKFIEISAFANKQVNAGAWMATQHVWLNNIALTLVDDKGLLAPLKPLAKATLEEAVHSAVRAAPAREDMVSPFLYNLDAFTLGSPERAKAILAKILAMAPNHRSALWLMGHELMRDESTQEEGKQMVEKAIQLGVQRVFPLTLQELQAE